MLPTVQLVEKAAALFQPTENGGSMPAWLELFYSSLCDDGNTRYIKIFLCKV